MKDLIDRLLDEVNQLTLDLQKSENNKSAAQRVRVRTLGLEKSFKEFRKLSVEHFKVK
jgi:hypothetical protein